MRLKRTKYKYNLSLPRYVQNPICVNLVLIGLYRKKNNKYYFPFMLTIIKITKVNNKTKLTHIHISTRNFLRGKEKECGEKQKFAWIKNCFFKNRYRNVVVHKFKN
jgi:hypothetical protein